MVVPNNTLILITRTIYVSIVIYIIPGYFLTPFYCNSSPRPPPSIDAHFDTGSTSEDSAELVVILLLRPLLHLQLISADVKQPVSPLSEFGTVVRFPFHRDKECKSTVSWEHGGFEIYRAVYRLVLRGLQRR